MAAEATDLQCVIIGDRQAQLDAGLRGWSSTGAILNVPAVLVIVIITALLTIGIRESAKFNDFIVALKLIVILLFIICAVPAFSTANWVTSSNPAGALV